MALTGKVVLITGAGSGIGKATAVLLAKHGVRVAALSHTEDEVKQTAAEIERDGGQGDGCRCRYASGSADEAGCPTGG